MSLLEQEKKIIKNVRGPVVKQFEWFQMETRVRKIIQQVIHPIQHEIVKNSSHIENLQQCNNTFNQKIQYMLEMTANDPQIFQRGIFKRIQEKFEMQQKTLSFLQEQVKNNTNFIDNKINLIDERMKQSNDMISQIWQLKASNRQNLKIQTQKFETVRKNIEKNVQSMSDAIEQNQKNSRQKIQKLEKQISENEMKLQNISKQFVKVKGYFEGQKSTNDNLIAQQIKLKEENRFIQEKMGEISKKIKQLNKIKPFLQDIQTEYKKVLFKVDNIVPLITESQINECFYRVLPQKFHPRVAVHEFERYKDLNEKVLNRHFETQPLGMQFNGEMLIRSAQQRNTKLLTKLKIKHYKNMGVELDFISFQQREKLMNDFNYEKLRQIIDQLQELENQENLNKKNMRLTQEDVLNIVQKQLQVQTLRLVEKIQTQIQHGKIDIQSTSEVISNAIEKLEQRLQKVSENLNLTKTNLEFSIKDSQQSFSQIKAKYYHFQEKFNLFHHFSKNTYESLGICYSYLMEINPTLKQHFTQSQNQIFSNFKTSKKVSQMHLESTKVKIQFQKDSDLKKQKNQKMCQEAKQFSLINFHDKFPILLENMKNHLQTYKSLSENNKFESSQKNRSSNTKLTKTEETFAKYRSYSSFFPNKKEQSIIKFQKSGSVLNQMEVNKLLKLPEFKIDSGRKYIRQSHTSRIGRGKKGWISPSRAKFQQLQLQGD